MKLASILNFVPGYQAWRSRTSIGGGGIGHAAIETVDENDIQNTARANASLADIRDFIRNTSFGQALMNQIKVNAVGTIGGSLAFATKDEDFNESVNRDWARYSRFCGFKDGSSLNAILRDLVGCLFFNGGDALVVFDDGRITGGRGTGKLLIFESDQVYNVPEKYFATHFPANWRQKRGIIYDEYDREVGFFASAKRGLKEMPIDANGNPQFLTFVDKHPDLDPEKRPFYLIKRTWRPNQGRGTAAILHVIDDLMKLNELQAAENDAANLNAHIGLAISEDASASDMLVTDALMNGQTPTQQSIKFDAMLRRRSAVLQLPKGKSVTAFDTKRPNDRVIDFIDSQKALIAAAFGLGKQFYTLTPESSFTAHRGAMQMAWQTIKQVQTDLGVFCNWLASQWFYWRRTDPNALTRLAVSEDILAEIDFCTEWMWPNMPEVDNVSYQNATTAALQNGTLTMRKLKGPGWRKDADQQSVEREYYQALGAVYPGDRMATGGVVENPNDTKKEETDGK